MVKLIDEFQRGWQGISRPSLVFSIGFAMTLVAVGIVAAKVGERILDWLASIWMIRLQIATSLLIVAMGVVLTVRATSELAALPAG